MTYPEPPAVDWAALDALLAAHPLVVERPRGAAHPRFPEVVYPLDYGYLDGVPGEDGEPLDVFFGTVKTGLVGAIRTVDARKGDTEIKLLWNCDPTEVYTALGFLSYDPLLMRARLAMRRPMPDLWAAIGDET